MPTLSNRHCTTPGNSRGTPSPKSQNRFTSLYTPSLVVLSSNRTEVSSHPDGIEPALTA